MIKHIRYCFRSGVPESEIAWCVQLYHSREQLEWCAAYLRGHYPRARVCVVSDGDGVSYGDLARKYRLTYIEGEHLMTLATCHLYVERLLNILLDGPEEYLFRIDPDTRVWRPFISLPAFSCLFGTLESISENYRSEIMTPPNVQGGCIGMTRDVAQEIRNSGIIGYQNCTVDYANTWARCTDMLCCASSGSFADDYVLSWAADQLNIPILDSPEIRSRWRIQVDNTGLRYAVTHPHKVANPSIPTNTERGMNDQ